MRLISKILLPLTVIPMSSMLSACNSPDDDLIVRAIEPIQITPHRSELAAFDVLFEKVTNGDNVDCESLVNTTVMINASKHAKESHAASRVKVTLHDYMSMTGNYFADKGACLNEIENARVSMCDSVDAMIDSVIEKNASTAAEERQDDGVFLHGYSVSYTAKEFCTEYSWSRPKTALLYF
ncbi:hypothetical protein BM525_19890 (plasmid) [Alteromonas mediterranea]|uniref:Lipoprotein n=1 Tax=Alteromonas mediterranea TaxID=314275 RepID=A0AAC9NTX2_9ALTE|nr:hypothetical protein [Alteromonas mediterranea]APD92146.1 hypothetical protein BM524_19695 [Alteromonas mediterranea]APE00001.1 hypothetical protein BM525_19890 [Alteromonas mediterranea]